MYPAMELDNGSYYPKPMNCPMHCLIYRSRMRSYRELPLRLFELGTVYRYERAGTLHGLLRIRGFTQDDAHIFCTAEQAHGEIRGLLSFVLSVLRAFGFEEFVANLSTRDPFKSIGNEAAWETATAALRAALEEEGLEYEIKEGDARLLRAEDRHRRARRHRSPLAAVDHPVRLQPAGAVRAGVRRGRQRAPPAGDDPPRADGLDRAVLRCPDRALRRAPSRPGCPRSRPACCRSRPSTRPTPAAWRPGCRARASGSIRSTRRTSWVARIRAAKLEKLPYVLVVGDDDVAAGTLGVNPRGGDVERDVLVDDFVARLRADVAVATVSPAV